MRGSASPALPIAAAGCAARYERVITPENEVLINDFSFVLKYIKASAATIQFATAAFVRVHAMRMHLLISAPAA